MSVDRLLMPVGLAWMTDVARMQPWLVALPGLVERAGERWSLDLGAPFADSHISWVAPARRRDGTAAVLKVQFPHPECEHEAEALRHWGGDGAVRLVEHDRTDHALLIERCAPGTHLSAAEPDAALDVICDLLGRLLVPAGSPFRTLEDEASSWADTLAERWDAAGGPFAQHLIGAALTTLAELIASVPADRRLLHQDLHGGNVCAAERQPWLAIDPKPLAGDPAFAPAPVVRSHELGRGRRATLRRLDALSEALGLDRTRVTAWAFGQTVAWAIDDENGGAHPRHVETAGWLLERLERSS